MEDTTGQREPDLEPLFNIVGQCLQDSDRWFPGTPASIMYLTVCLAGEVGEFANMVKKIERHSLDPHDTQVAFDLRMELVDVFIYTCNLAGRLGLDLAAGYKAKRELNDARFSLNQGEAVDE